MKRKNKEEEGERKTKQKTGDDTLTLTIRTDEDDSMVVVFWPETTYYTSDNPPDAILQPLKQCLQAAGGMMDQLYEHTGVRKRTATLAFKFFNAFSLFRSYAHDNSLVRIPGTESQRVDLFLMTEGHHLKSKDAQRVSKILNVPVIYYERLIMGLNPGKMPCLLHYPEHFIDHVDRDREIRLRVLKRIDDDGHHGYSREGKSIDEVTKTNPPALDVQKLLSSDASAWDFNNAKEKKYDHPDVQELLQGMGKETNKEMDADFKAGRRGRYVSNIHIFGMPDGHTEATWLLQVFGRVFYTETFDAVQKRQAEIGEMLLRIHPIYKRFLALSVVAPAMRSEDRRVGDAVLRELAGYISSKYRE